MSSNRRPPAIVEIGVEHWAEGSGNIKQFLLGGPDVGKTRVASAFPRPLWLACEPIETVAASIATRRIQYLEGLRPPRVVDVRSTDDMIATIEKLEQQLRTAGPMGPAYRTVVVDTFDGFQRIIKDEWSAAQDDGIFTGRDAWSYLEAKCSLVLTRLLALDMNVIVLCHLQEKTVGEGDSKVTTYGPFLQGQTKDSIFHDFNLVGLMQFEWTPGEQGDRERKRGITYEPTPTYPFLKDHFHLTPPEYRINNKRCWPVTLDDGTRGGKSDPATFIDVNYGQIAGAIIAGLDGLDSSTTVEVLDTTGPSPEGVAPPGRGGPVAGAPATPPAAAKKTAAPKKEAAPSTPPQAEKPSAPSATQTPSPDSANSSPPSSAAAPSAPAAEASTASTPAPPAAPSAPSDGAAAVGPADPAPAPAAEPAEVAPPAPQTAVPSEASAAPGPAAQPEQSGAESAPAEPTLDQAVETVQEALGGEVVTDEPQADASTESGNLCPVCKTKDLTTESADLVQLSRLKHRDLRLTPDAAAKCEEGCPGGHLYDTPGCCFECYQRLNAEKANKTGHYAA